MNKLRWGILSTAKIAREKVIPAMQASAYCDIVAIASRNRSHAADWAAKLGVPVAHDSYEAMVNDPSIDAVYIPLPNHLHVEWAIKAIQAGKHVLCEKPIALSAEQAQQLLDVAAARPQLKVMEAFMYRFHPQWQCVKELTAEKMIGEVKAIQSFFSYHNTDPLNIRNSKEAGGGALMDIGCYCISISRFLAGEEPTSVLGEMEFDPVFKTDRLTSGILRFSGITSSFTCSTQLMPYQRVNVLGTEGRIEMEIPFNAPHDKITRVWVYGKKGIQEIPFVPVDQYTLQADAFCRAIIHNEPVPTPLEDALNNMKVIGAVFKSAETGTWIKPA